MRKKRSYRARLGQHFLVGQWAAAKLAGSIDIRPGETILEIGPGKGALTKELLKTGARVVAVEKDPALVLQLRDTFKNEIASQQLELIEQDIRDFDSGSWKLAAGSYSVAANIPYYITGEIIRQFLTANPQPRALALLVQNEVAKRIVGKAIGNRQQAKESILSLSVKAYGTPKIIAKVGRGNFSPPPSVDSAILLIDDVSRIFFADMREEDFFKVVHAGFASKRKLLSSNLMNNIGFTKPYIIQAFDACDIPQSARAEDVPLEKWKCLARQLSVISGQLSEKANL